MPHSNLIFLLIVWIGLAGCVALPTPYDVARTCYRSQVSIKADGRTSSDGHYQTLGARCIDDAANGTTMMTAERSSNRQQERMLRFEDRNGPDEFLVKDAATADGNSSERHTMIRRKTWFGTITYENHTTINLPR